MISYNFFFFWLGIPIRYLHDGLLRGKVYGTLLVKNIQLRYVHKVKLECFS